MTSCHVKTSITSIVNQSKRVSSTEIQSDPKMDSFIAPYRSILNKKMNDTLAFNSVELIKGKGESELGNWVADGMKWYIDSVSRLEADMAFCNYGGLRTKSLPQGFIQLRHIFELMPFENILTVVELDSNELKTFLSSIIEKDGWPVSKGFTMTATNKELSDWSYLSHRKAKYKIILSDYIATGGDNMDFLTDNTRKDLSITIREALIAYSRYQKNLKSSKEGRYIKK